MKRLIISFLTVLIVGTGTAYSAEQVRDNQTTNNLDSIDIVVRYDVEFKPMSFYYEVDPYLPIKVLLEGSGFILDPQLGKQVEKSIGRATFMADPQFLRMPVAVSDVYNLDAETYDLDVERYHEKGMASWEIQILDMSGMNFRTIEGSGALPATVSWDGRAGNGEVISVGDVYTYNVRLRTKDERTIRKGGGTIDLNGVAYENVVSIKESEMDAGSLYGEVSGKVANYYQMVINRFKEGGYSGMTITASDREYAEFAAEYLSGRLLNVPIEVRENPEFPRVQFVFN